MKTLLWAWFSSLVFLNAIQAAPRQLSLPAAQALHLGTNVTLYSLDPAARGPRTNSLGFFHRWRILGKTPLTAEQAKSVAVKLEIGIGGERRGVSALCFDPGHGLRAIFDNKRYDFVICYKCSSLQIIHPGREMEYLLLEDSPDQLNALLTAAGIPLAKL